MQPLYITRAGLIGTLVALGVAALCVRLGVWQLERLEQRRERNAAIAERIHDDPLVLAGTGASDTTGMLYRRVVLRGRFDHGRTVILPGRSRMGRTGAHLVTPLHLEDGSGGAILVNRGWIPTVDPASVDLSAFAAPARATALEAVLLPFPSDLDSRAGEEEDDRPAARAEATAEDRRASTEAPASRRIHYRIDPRRIGADLPYPLFGAYARALDGGGDPVGGGGGAAAAGADGRGPAPLPPPSLDDGPHLSYAIQWFSFGAIALVGWTVLALRRGEAGRRRRLDD